MVKTYPFDPASGPQAIFTIDYDEAVRLAASNLGRLAKVRGCWGYITSMDSVYDQHGKVSQANVYLSIVTPEQAAAAERDRVVERQRSAIAARIERSKAIIAAMEVEMESLGLERMAA